MRVSNLYTSPAILKKKKKYFFSHSEYENPGIISFALTTHLRNVKENGQPNVLYRFVLFFKGNHIY